MQFTVTTSTLSKQLQAISGTLGGNNILPILGNFLFSIKDGVLSIAATDLQTSMTTFLAVESTDNACVAIPARILLDTLRSLPEQPLLFLVNEDNFAIEIRTNNGQYKLFGVNGADFPQIPTVDDAPYVDLPAPALLEAINKTLCAVGSDGLRLSMTGVYCQLYPEHITFVATDAHKLVRYRRMDAKSAYPVSFILPKKALNLLKSSLPTDPDASLSLSCSTTSAFFKFGHINLICRLIDERYPDYESVIPRDNPNKLLIDRLDLLGAVSRVSLYANKTTHQVRLKITQDALILTSEDIDFANEAEEHLSCQYEGEDLEIAFNARFLLELLKNTHTEIVLLTFSSPKGAGLILPQNLPDQEDLLMLVMPVMPQGVAN